jgi:hypothetical protein
MRILIIGLFLMFFGGKLEAQLINCETKLRYKRNDVGNIVDSAQLSIYFTFRSDSDIDIKVDYMSIFRPSPIYYPIDETLSILVDSLVNNSISHIIIENEIGRTSTISLNLSFCCRTEWNTCSNYDIFHINTCSKKTIKLPVIPLESLYILNREVPIIRFHLILMRIIDCEENPIVITSDWINLNSVK